MHALLLQIFLLIRHANYTRGRIEGGYSNITTSLRIESCPSTCLGTGYSTSVVISVDATLPCNGTDIWYCSFTILPVGHFRLTYQEVLVLIDPLKCHLWNNRDVGFRKV
jgi:hypothetical protein